jgi:hypothetical protein
MRSLRKISLLVSTFIHIPALAADRDMSHRHKILSLIVGLILLAPRLLAVEEKFAKDDLTTILNKCAEYCRKLADSALYFICQEKINEEIYEFRSGGTVVVTGGEGDTITYGTASSFKRRANRNVYIYDYQLIKKGERIEETRTLLEENGKKKDLKNAPLKTKRFFSRKAVFGPVGFFGREWHEVYDYELLKQDRVKGREAYVIKAKPKVPIEGKPNYGTLWVGKTDFSVLKMEVEDQSLAGFEKALEDAKSRGLKPILTTVHEYEILKNGLRFPSRTVFNEKYSGSRSSGFTQSKTEISYKNYRFFTVETQVIY